LEIEYTLVGARRAWRRLVADPTLTDAAERVQIWSRTINSSASAPGRRGT
jgi:hypothetical protein